jgi:type IV pilus assembly protein PilW
MLIRYGGRGHAGFSLIELMVGVAVALISLLVLTGMLMGFNVQKKTTVSSSDAQVAGGVAAFMIERDLRRAGFGFNSEPLLGCSLHLLDTGGGPDPLPLQPVRIMPGATDQVAITYSTGRHGWYYANMTPPTGTSFPGDDSDLVVDNIYGFSVGDLIAVGQNGVDPDADGIADCSLREVTAIDNASFRLSHSGGTFNKPGGEGIPYSKGARVYNLGLASAAELPEIVTYGISANNELTMTSRQTQFQAVPVGEHIVMLRAWYCKDLVNLTPSTISTCDQTIPVNAAGWRQVLAVRFAVVARSPNRESTTVSDATLQLWPDMTLPNGVVVAGPTMALTEEQQHYRYRVYGTLVPVRNLLWQIPN